MARATVRWVSPPSRIGQTIRSRAERAGDAVLAVGQSHASRMASEAQAIGPYQDRTGNLRQSMTGQADKNGQVIRVQVFSPVEYAPYVELGTSRAAAYPSILPAVQQGEGPLVQDAAEAVKRVMGG